MPVPKTEKFYPDKAETLFEWMMAGPPRLVDGKLLYHRFDDVDEEGLIPKEYDLPGRSKRQEAFEP